DWSSDVCSSDLAVVIVIEDSGNRRPQSSFGLVAVHLEHETHLFEIVLTTRAAGRFSRSCQGRKQDSSKNTDNGDNNQQFNQGEAFGSHLKHSSLLRTHHSNGLSSTFPPKPGDTSSFLQPFNDD